MKKLTLIFGIILLLTCLVYGQCPDVNSIQGIWKEVKNYYNPPFNYKANAEKYDKAHAKKVEYYAADYRGNNTESAGVQYFIVKKEEVPLFIPVQRKEYLLQFREELKEYISLEKTRLQNWIKIAPEDESSKNFLIRFESFMGKYQKAVDDYLTNISNEELSKTVFELLPLIPSNTVSPAVEFSEKGKTQLVYYNDKYMNPKLKDDVPQFIIIELRAEGDNRENRFQWRWKLREKFSDNLDFEGLKKLLII